MSQELWTAVDRYIDDTLVGADPILDDVVRECDAAGLPHIAVSPSQGKLLFLLARMAGARNILEIGTLGGYSGIWLARALPPGGRLVTLEYEPAHAAVARRNFQRAGVMDRVDLRLGRALDVLPQLHAEPQPAFDFIFIDADKENYPDYLKWSIALARAGTVIVADNVIREGAVIDAGSDDPRVIAVRDFLAALQTNTHVSATALQTVGVKGYDGLAIAVVTKASDR